MNLQGNVLVGHYFRGPQEARGIMTGIILPTESSWTATSLQEETISEPVPIFGTIGLSGLAMLACNARLATWLSQNLCWTWTSSELGNQCLGKAHSYNIYWTFSWFSSAVQGEPFNHNRWAGPLTIHFSSLLIWEGEQNQRVKRIPLPGDPCPSSPGHGDLHPSEREKGIPFLGKPLISVCSQEKDGREVPSRMLWSLLPSSWLQQAMWGSVSLVWFIWWTTPNLTAFLRSVPILSA